MNRTGSRRIRKSVQTLPHPGPRLLVFYDGHCVLCNGAVRWLLARDKFDRLRFAPASSPRAVSFLRNQSPAGALASASILVVRDPGAESGQLLARSAAIVAVLSALPQPWPAVAAALGLIPRPIRDLAYRLVARSRYRIWGRLEGCPLPTAAERAKFL